MAGEQALRLRTLISAACALQVAVGSSICCQTLKSCKDWGVSAFSAKVESAPPHSLSLQTCQLSDSSRGPPIPSNEMCRALLAILCQAGVLRRSLRTCT